MKCRNYAFQPLHCIHTSKKLSIFDKESLSAWVKEWRSFTHRLISSMILFFALILSLDFSIRIFFDKTCSVSLTIIRIRMRITTSFGVFFSSKGIQAWNFPRRSHDFHQGEIWRARFLGEAVKGEWRRETRLKPPFSSSNELHELRSLWTFFLVSFKRCSITHMLCALSLPKKGPFFATEVYLS